MATRDKSAPLAFLTPRETDRMARARAPRHLVGGLRYGLPVIALVLLAALILWPHFNPDTIRKTVMTRIPDIVIRNPHYSGLDSKNQAYVLSAATATRPGGMNNIYDLTRPEGEIQMQSGNWISGKAQYGRYDQDSRKLWLGGDVHLFHDKGYEFSSSEAQVDIDGNYAWGDKPVLIQGGFGEIRGQGFRVLDDGQSVVVTGPAKAVLNLRGGIGSDKPAGTK